MQLDYNQNTEGMDCQAIDEIPPAGGSFMLQRDDRIGHGRFNDLLEIQ